MPRTFDGVDDSITLSLGNLGFAFGPGTMAAIVKRSADSGNQDILCVGVSSSARYIWIIASNNVMRLVLDGSTAESTAGVDTCLVADGWLLLAVTKATGTVGPRFHRYEYATNVWQHVDSNWLVANSTAPTTNAFVGKRHDGSNWYPGDVGVVGVWDAVLFDTQIEKLAYSLPAWFTIQPKGLLLFYQATTGQKVVDITGGGANESAITGTAVGTSSMPVFSYGAPIMVMGFNALVPVALAGKLRV